MSPEAPGPKHSSSAGARGLARLGKVRFAPVPCPLEAARNAQNPRVRLLPMPRARPAPSEAPWLELSFSFFDRGSR